MRLDTTFLLGVWLEALCYGIYVAAFVVCLRLFRTRAPSVGRALPIWLVALFILATAHCALSLSAALDAFVRQTYPPPFSPPPSPSLSPPAPGRPAPSPIPGSPNPSPMPLREFHDPNFYISNRALPTNLASLGVYAGIVLISDLMMLYRLLVMYRYNFVWTIGPAVLTIASFAISMVVVSKYSHINLSASKDAITIQLATVDPWVPPLYAISFLASLSIAALMLIRTTFANSSSKPTIPAFARAGRRHTRQTSLTAGDGYVFDMDERTGPVPVSSAPTLPSDRTISHKWIVLAGIVESGALAPVFMLSALILYVVQDGQETLLVPLLAPIAALVPTLQIIQIQLGLDSCSRAFHPTPTTAGPGIGPTMAGRSPYLVPAPRYRDSFSSSEDEADDKFDVDRNSRPRQGGQRPPVGRPWSARWAWRGSGSGSGSASGSHERSLSGSSGNPTVALPLQDLSRPVPKDDPLWERVKFDDSAPATTPARRSTLRKSGTVVKGMISKPVPVAADFPPSTAAIPSTTVPLPSFTITAAQATAPTLGKVPSLSKMASGNLGRSSSGKDKDTTAGGEHKYHYRMRPRERTASHLAAYLTAQAIAQQEQPTGNPNSSSGHPGSNVGHANLMSLPSTVPTSPASGFTSLAPNPNPFRYDAATPPPPQPQLQHRRSYSDVQRGDAPLPQPGLAGVGLAGAHRTPLTFPFAPDPERETVQRWGALPGAPYIPGLGGTIKVERDVSPAPGLQRDYARARDEVLRRMQRERTGAMSDDESVYSTQPMSGVGWKSFPSGGR